MLFVNLFDFNRPTDSPVARNGGDTLKMNSAVILGSIGFLIIPKNFVEAFAEGELLGVVCFALVLGYFLNQDKDDRRKCSMSDVIDASASQRRL